MSRSCVLVVGALDRPDIIKMFDDVRDSVQLHFLEYFYNYGVPTDVRHYASYGRVHFWHEYRHAGELLDEIKPDRIVFFYLTSLGQVALRAVARDRKIPALHLEHGFRQRFDESFEAPIMKRYNSLRFDRAKLQREFKEIVGNHAFFLRTVPIVQPPHRRALACFGGEIYWRGISPALLLRYADLRRADRYIAFSPEFFEFHRVQDAIIDWRTRVSYIGIPQFDAYADVAPESIDPRNVVLIDHQFHNANLFGWTPEFRRDWVQQLRALVRDLGLRLFVKLHPGDVSGMWNEHASPGEVEIVDHRGLLRAIRATSVVLGTISTMQLPLAALPHTALLTLEMHPERERFLSLPLVRAGVADPVHTFDELRHALANIEPLRLRQQTEKAAFTRQFLHRLDGRAGERLRGALSDSERGFG